MKSIIRAFTLLPGWKKLLFGVLVVGILQSAVTVAVPLAIQRIIDNLILSLSQDNVSTQVFITPLLVWLGLRVGLSLVVWLGEIVSDNAFTKSIISFREQTVRRLEKLPVSYYETRRAGQLTAEVNQSPHLFGRWIQDVCENYLTTILQALFAIGVLGYKFLPIAVVVLVLAVIYWAYTFKTIKTNSGYWKENRKIINEWSGVQTENISFVADIRALGVQKERGKLYSRLLHQHETNLGTMWRFQHRRNFVATLIEILMYGLPIALFSYRALQGDQSPTDIYVLSVYLGSISTAVNRLNRMWSETKSLDDTLAETLEILDQQDTVIDPQQPRLLKAINEVRFNNVTFNYQNTKNSALTDVSFAVKNGSTTALVGRSGSGKSTIIKLLLRFYDANNGEVLLNNEPLTDYRQDDVRKKMGVVMQDVALFNDTIMGNITIAQPSATKASVIRACKRAHAHEFISALPNGYETLVGERGVKLSGGEKQRVSIARAILRDPELILLDEATSALDSESEKAVQSGLAQLLKNRTAIIIAHRLSTIKHADNILVIDKGKIVESGTYEQLKRKNGLFTELLAHQEL
jgi:ABC-type multidrug transport system fused ATPase/permease subunit